MPSVRLHLTDSNLLRLLMRWAPDGKPLSIRDLAAETGTSKSKIQALLSGTRPTIEAHTADQISHALGVHERALFFKPVPPLPGRVAAEGDDQHGQHQRTVDGDAPRGSQELGRHHRPISSDRIST